jgi:L-asparaginase
MPKRIQPVLIIHGGAGGTRPNQRKQAILDESMSYIVNEGYKLLREGKSAVDVVVHATRLLEDDPLYNAGRGSKIQADGKIRMSASLMDGDSLRFSGVLNVQGLKHPIDMAHFLNDKDTRVLSDRGAVLKAREWMHEFRSPYTALRREEYSRGIGGKTGTVGAVALDERGRIAAATSTGGRGMEWPGRVSDSPTVAGNYANEYVGLSATGIGEQIVDFALCAKIATRVEDGMPLKSAFQKSFREARARNYAFGAIALNDRGEYAAATTTPCMVWAVADGDGVRVSF